MGEIKKFLSDLVETWREHVEIAREQARAQRETTLATVVLAENVAALRESVERSGQSTAVAFERMMHAVETEAAAPYEGTDS